MSYSRLTPHSNLPYYKWKDILAPTHQSVPKLTHNDETINLILQML